MIVPFRIDTDHADSLHAVHSVYCLTRGLFNGPPTRYVKSRFVPGIPGTSATCIFTFLVRGPFIHRSVDKEVFWPQGVVNVQKEFQPFHSALLIMCTYG